MGTSGPVMRLFYLHYSTCFGFSALFRRAISPGWGFPTETKEVFMGVNWCLKSDP